MKERIQTLLTDLIKFQSVESNIDELHNVISFCESLFDSDSYVTKRYEHNSKSSLLVSTENDVEEFDVLLNGHLDVVAAEPEEFIPRIEEGILYARGAIDMKGPVSVLLTIMKNINTVAPGLKVGLLLTTDEEVGGPDGVGYIFDTEPLKAKVALVPDGGKIDTIVTSQKGILRFRMEAKGLAAHASSPWKGKNAIDIIIECYDHIRSKYKNPDTDIWGPTINLGKIQAGESVNKVPDQCIAWLDMRYTEERSKEDWIQDIESICKKFDVSTTLEIAADMAFTDEKNKYLQLFRDVSADVLKREVIFGKENGGSDARYISAKGIPVIMSNPVGGNFHNKNEYVELASLHQYYLIISQFLQRFKAVEN